MPEKVYAVILEADDCDTSELQATFKYPEDAEDFAENLRETRPSRLVSILTGPANIVFDMA